MSSHVKLNSKQASKYVSSCACLSVVRLVCQSDPVRSDKTDGYSLHLYFLFDRRHKCTTLVRSGRKDGPGCQGSSLLLLLSTGCREVSQAMSLAQWQVQHLIVTLPHF